MSQEVSKIKISICIATRNRARFLAETLENIIPQANDCVEIVIVDGASTDNTADIVHQFQKRSHNIIYHRLEKNGGVDRDIARTIEFSRGDYCWIFSDDDFLKPGAIERMLKEIESQCEIYLCNVTACNLAMHPWRDRFWLSSKVQDKIFHLHEKKEFIEYCNSADSLGALFSYNCSIILRREEWNKTGFNHAFDRTAYELAAALFFFMKRTCRLKYIKDSLVFWRNDNESFQDAGGLVKRFLLDFDGYLQLADTYLADDQQKRDAFLAVMRREHPWYTIINVTSFIDNQESWREFKGKMLAFGYSPRMAQLCFAAGRYKHLVAFGVMIKRKILKSRRMNRVAELLWAKR